MPAWPKAALATVRNMAAEFHGLLSRDEVQATNDCWVLFKKEHAFLWRELRGALAVSISF